MMPETDHERIERLAYEAERWRLIAGRLYEELKRWGWGDFHYGSQPQDSSVVAALKVYEEARDA